MQDYKSNLTISSIRICSSHPFYDNTGACGHLTLTTYVSVQAAVMFLQLTCMLQGAYAGYDAEGEGESGLAGSGQQKKLK